MQSCLPPEAQSMLTSLTNFILKTTSYWAYTRMITSQYFQHKLLNSSSCHEMICWNCDILKVLFVTWIIFKYPKSVLIVKISLVKYNLLFQTSESNNCDQKTAEWSMAEYLASIFGTEKDKVNCSFFFKTGACTHGDRCSRIHNKPTFSQTVLMSNLYINPQVTTYILFNPISQEGGFTIQKSFGINTFS